MERLGGLDGAFLYCETPTMHLHVCGLLILDPTTIPSGYSFDRFRSVLALRLTTIRAVHQRLAAAPLHLGRPFWTDDPKLDLDHHLQHLVLDPPGDDRILADVVGAIAGRQLRRDMPLWEISVIEGLAGGRVAVLLKMHHSIIDGVSAANVMGHLLDLEPAPEPRSPSKTRRPLQKVPNPMALLGRGLADRLTEPLALARLLPESAVRLATTLRLLKHGGDRRTPMAIPFTAPRTTFNATLTERRSVAFVDVALADVKAVKAIFGVTMNDVITAVVSGAIRRHLEDRGELPDRPLLAAVPVSVHDQTADRKGTTKVSVMFSTLATDEGDPVERLKTIALANTRAKEIHQTMGADTLMRWTELAWLNALGVGARLYSTLRLADHHRVVHNLILSNVAGPPVPLYLAGAHVVGLYPFGPITDGAGLNVTVLSQGDRVGFGIITCPDLVPRVWDLAGAIPGALKELVEAACISDCAEPSGDPGAGHPPAAVSGRSHPTARLPLSAQGTGWFDDHGADEIAASEVPGFS
ncbi:MAG TPA: wax ester/triacylglycerol synthase family O-acyltransferase [Acidimicrobiales bacterium]|nr:wax ester/triacylglycerol synthase family O-acyltransferase [Acidimicrobiales bacterium]